MRTNDCSVEYHVLEDGRRVLMLTDSTGAAISYQTALSVEYKKGGYLVKTEFHIPIQSVKRGADFTDAVSSAEVDDPWDVYDVGFKAPV